MTEEVGCKAQSDVSFFSFSRVDINRNILKNPHPCLLIFINANSIDFNIQFASKLERIEIALENAFFLAANNKYFSNSQ